MYLPGFEMPDYVQSDLKKRTYKDARGKLELLYQMILQNYQAEHTQVSHWGMGSWIVLELLTIHNLFNKMAWNRLFFNEELYITSS